MKKILITFILLISISLTACTGSDLENYQAAMDKTDNMVRGSESLELNIKTKYNTQGLEEEVQMMIKSYEDSKFTLKGSFDKEEKKSMQRGYLNSGDFGYDFNIYEVDNKYFVEPFFLNLKDHRYIEISEEKFQPSESEMSSDFFQKIGGKWNEIINEENVMKGEKVLVTTDDGEIKSSEFTITLNDQQLKEFILYIIKLIEENDEYIELMDQFTYLSEEEQLSQVDKKEIYREMFSGLKDFITTSENLNLSYKAYIDVDNYVVQEDINFSMDNDTNEAGGVLRLEFSMTNKYWNIEKEQDLDFEIPTAENSIKLEEIKIEELFPQREVK